MENQTGVQSRHSLHTDRPAGQPTAFCQVWHTRQEKQQPVQLKVTQQFLVLSGSICRKKNLSWNSTLSINSLKMVLVLNFCLCHFGFHYQPCCRLLTGQPKFETFFLSTVFTPSPSPTEPLADAYRKIFLRWLGGRGPKLTSSPSSATVEQ
jgi:hypothetical protein